jgi:hypothetical protein
MATPPDFTNGTPLDASSLNKAGLWLVNTTTIGNGVTSVPVNNCFPTDFSAFRIIIENLDTNGSASHDIQLQGISTTTYFTGGNFMSWASSAITGYGPAAMVTWIVSANVPAGTGTVITLDLWNPNQARRKYGVSHGIAGNGHSMLNLYSTSSATATGFNLGKSGNTMTGGTIRVYGYRN